MIINIFPNAKFIITERNIGENIIGIYKKILLDIPWAHSISEIVKYIKNYKTIIDIYVKKYSEKFFIIKLIDLQSSNKKKYQVFLNFVILILMTNILNFKNKINSLTMLAISKSERNYLKTIVINIINICIF